MGVLCRADACFVPHAAVPAGGARAGCGVARWLLAGPRRAVQTGGRDCWRRLGGQAGPGGTGMLRPACAQHSCAGRRPSRPPAPAPVLSGGRRIQHRRPRWRPPRFPSRVRAAWLPQRPWLLPAHARPTSAACGAPAAPLGRRPPPGSAMRAWHPARPPLRAGCRPGWPAGAGTQRPRPAGGLQRRPAPAALPQRRGRLTAAAPCCPALLPQSSRRGSATRTGPPRRWAQLAEPGRPASWPAARRTAVALPGRRLEACSAQQRASPCCRVCAAGRCGS